MYKTALCAIAVLFGAAIASTNSPSSFPRVVAKVAITGRTSAIPATTLLTPASNALYRVSAYGVVTVPNGNTAFWHLKLNWTDDYGSENCYNGTQQGTSCTLLKINSNWENFGQYRWGQQGAWVVRANAGTPLSYSMADVGGATGSTYDLFLTVEQIE
jgi:hypothetical protein